MVETIAHYTAARFADPDVSFILDIGGQDMKAIFINQGVISRIELNEACSSGCGSFLETLAASVQYGIQDFARLACEAQAPCDLGTRCTVFMNSKIKQSLRENAALSDISAGLAYSVIKNCLFKVLKLHDMSDMGDHIVLQGGTFKNPSIVRAMELLSRKTVTVSTMPELMGAFGAALIAWQDYREDASRPGLFAGLSRLEALENFKTRQVICKGCENQCAVTRFDFLNGTHFYSGNKCESVFVSKGDGHEPGFNFITYKEKLIFDRPLTPHEKPLLTLGIPRCLNFYENFPFWHALFVYCGINLKLSPPSTMALCEKGMGSVMSDNICFPAKLVHGHIRHLAQPGLNHSNRKQVSQHQTGQHQGNVNRIFYPMVVYEKDSFEGGSTAYNCPIVTSYADVLESAMTPAERYGVPLDRPTINFNDSNLLEKSCIKYLKTLGVKASTARAGVHKGLEAFAAFKGEIREKADRIVSESLKNQRMLIVLAGRPYHLDPLINHKIPDVLSRMGVDIISEDVVPLNTDALQQVHVAAQWEYPNRIYAAAQWTAKQPGHVQMVQLNSFGCGPDAIVMEETGAFLKAAQKNHTVIRIDEISSPGSVRLRLRSLIESLRGKDQSEIRTPALRKPFIRFGRQDRERTIWAPFFSEDYSPYLKALFKNAGYEFDILPPPDRKSADLGLRYASNDICYPGTLVIGDIIKALKTRFYNPNDIAVGITQTGGQCRASNYLALIRKAMERAGFGDIPIISVAAGQGLVDQPGFEINWLKKIKILYVTTMFADCIAKMYYAVACRETIKGAAQKLRHRFMDKVSSRIVSTDYKGIYRLLNQAVAEFNAVPVSHRDLPKMGIVGEIYAKYNYFCNQDVVHWLMGQGIEPVLPPIVDYFIQDLVNYKENIKAGIRKRRVLDFLGAPIEWFVQAQHRKFNDILSGVNFCLPFEDIRHIAANASQIVTMTNQFGEGWLIPGEIATFARQGINHVISVQPFGCIANHIVSKGIEKRIRQLYPDLNLYFLDFDAGMSEANVRNRLHLMVEHI